MRISLQFLIGGFLLLAISVYHTSGQGVKSNYIPQRCYSPWVQIQDHRPGKSTCIWYSVDKDSWIGAAAWCRMIGGRLVELLDFRLGSNIVKHMPQPFKGKFWIGLSDIEANGVYKWMHSKQMVDRLLPYASNILPDETKNCVNIDEKGHLHAEVCNAQFQFVCEK